MVHWTVYGSIVKASLWVCAFVDGSFHFSYSIHISQSLSSSWSKGCGLIIARYCSTLYNVIPLHPKITLGRNFSIYLIYFSFIDTNPSASNPYPKCCFVSDIESWIYVSTKVRNRHLKSVGCLLKESKYCCDICFFVCFRSINNKKIPSIHVKCTVPVLLRCLQPWLSHRPSNVDHLVWSPKAFFNIFNTSNGFSIVPLAHSLVKWKPSNEAVS